MKSLLFKPLPLTFYQRKTEVVAKELLGKILVRKIDAKTTIVTRIVETEAYLGISDKACHTYKDKRTARTEPMYLSGGHVYVYLIYGMHYCLNVVSEKEGVPEAVLIRALEPIKDLNPIDNRLAINKLIQKIRDEERVYSGPGKLCKALQINKNYNGHLLNKAPLFIADGSHFHIKKNQFNIIETTRIGVDYAGEDASLLLRYYIKDNPFISKK